VFHLSLMPAKCNGNNSTCITTGSPGNTNSGNSGIPVILPSQNSPNMNTNYYIVAGVLGAFLLCLILAIIAALLIKRRKKKKESLELVEAVKVVQIREDVKR